MPLVIPTERPELILRQFIPEDSRPLFELIERNRAHLSKYLDDTSDKYPDFDSVLRSMTYPSKPEKLRFGVWDGEVLVGTVNLLPLHRLAVLGYWVGAEYTKKGYATTAAQALCQYANDILGLGQIIAFVHKENFTSQGVLQRCGFESRGKASLTTETALVFKRQPRRPS